MWEHSIDLLVLKKIQGGCIPQKLWEFCNLKALKYPKIDANNIEIINANLYRTNPLDYCNFQQGTMAHPDPH